MHTIAEAITYEGNSINEIYHRASERASQSKVDWIEGTKTFIFDDQSQMLFRNNMKEVLTDTYHSLQKRLLIRQKKYTLSSFGDEC